MGPFNRNLPSIAGWLVLLAATIVILNIYGLLYGMMEPGLYLLGAVLLAALLVLLFKAVTSLPFSRFLRKQKATAVANAKAVPFRKLAVHVPLILLALLGFGYLSAMLSVRTCENKVALWLANEKMKGEPFYFPIESPQSYDIFGRLQAADRLPARCDYSEVTKATQMRTCAVYYAHVRHPFLVTVPYLPSAADELRLRTFFCFFGLSTQVSDYTYRIPLEVVFNAGFENG